MSRLRRDSFALFLLCLLAAMPASSQAPVCDGISDVSDFDGPAVTDMAGALTTVRVVSGLTRPLFVTAPPGDVDQLFLVEQDGRIEILRDGAVLPKAFLDISAQTRSPADIGGGNEEGLLGLAFHPDYSTNGWFFVFHTDSTGSNNVIARYTVSADPDVADAASRTQVLSIPHTFASNHNGGAIGFGPADGYLYIGTGDGGSSCDPNGVAQSLGSLLGKLLRIDVDALPFSVPADNPFVGGVTTDDVIWSYGLRNPWRWSFDRITGALYIADVGQQQAEEINCRPASSAGGENYGWDRFEGMTCPNPSCGSQGSCLLTDNVLPVAEYDHTAGCSITGGYVYRGCRMSDLHGHYFYADFCTDFVESFRTDAACAAPLPVSRAADLAPGGSLDIGSIVSFGEDPRGEIYIVDRGGEVFKIVPELSILEVSGANATPFSAGNGGAWSWEDLAATSSHTITSYKVYRSDGDPAGPFDCVFQGATPAWATGDPDSPASGQAFFYLVTAVNSAGVETRPGNRSGSIPRTVNTGSACPSK